MGWFRRRGPAEGVHAMQQVVTRGRDTDVIGLAYGPLAPGETVQRGGGEEEVLAVVMEGDVAARAGDEDLGRTPPRSDVFRELGHAIYAPPAAPLRLVAGDSGAVVAVTTAPADGRTPGPGRM